MYDHPNILVAFTENHSLGHAFERWPHHITVLPWFKADKTALAGLESIAKQYLPLDVEIGKTARFGTHSDILVRLVESEALEQMHRDMLSKRGGLLGLANSRFVGAEYRSHVTLQGADDPAAGPFVITKLSLVKLTGPGKTKRIESIISHQ